MAAARKRTQSDSDTPAAEAQQRAQSGITSVVTSGGEAWIESQAQLLDRVDEMAKGWVQRRREALDAARHSIEEMRETRDFGDLLRIQQEWFSGSLQRLASDFEAMTRVTLNLSQGAFRRLAETSRFAGAEMRNVGEAVLSTAGDKPERPGESPDRFAAEPSGAEDDAAGSGEPLGEEEEREERDME